MPAHDERDHRLAVAAGLPILSVISPPTQTSFVHVVIAVLLAHSTSGRAHCHTLLLKDCCAHQRSSQAFLCCKRAKPSHSTCMILVLESRKPSSASATGSCPDSATGAHLSLSSTVHRADPLLSQMRICQWSSLVQRKCATLVVRALRSAAMRSGSAALVPNVMEMRGAILIHWIRLWTPRG